MRPRDTHSFISRRAYITPGRKMAMHQFPLSVAQMHTVALAIAPESAVGAFPGFHPVMVAVFFISVLPDFPEVVFIDITLPVVCAYARARPYPAVEKHRRHRHACLAVEEIVAHLPLVSCQKQKEGCILPSLRVSEMNFISASSSSAVSSNSG